MIPIGQIVSRGFEILGAAWSGWRKGAKEKEEETAKGWDFKTVTHVKKQSDDGATKWRIQPSVVPTLPPKSNQTINKTDK
jgi:hypothetical protein